jgi:N-acyl homoserine lactone hydrolase
VRIHALQTGTVRIHRRQRAGVGHGFRRQLNMLLDREWTEPLPIYAWLIDHPEGPIVVDTGETARASELGYFDGWHPYYRWAVRFDIRPEQEIGPRLRALGVEPGDVRQVVLTHLHTDHAGGLGHFEGREVLCSRRDFEIARGLGGRLGGYPNHRWPAWFAPRLIDLDGPAREPFPASHALTRAGDVYLVPTPGHTPGHISVVVEAGTTSYVLAGDASYTQALLLSEQVDGVSPDERIALSTMRRLKSFIDGHHDVRYLPSHDPAALERLTGA